jgi:hypothetical protein
VGFNPYARLADYLIAEARLHESRGATRLAATGDHR